MNKERGPRWAHQVLCRLSHAQVFGVAILGIAAVGIPDYLVGTEISLSVFYLGPVALATWYAGRRIGWSSRCCRHSPCSQRT